MSLHLRSLTLLLAGLAAPLGAFAQADQAAPATSSSQSTAQSEAGEPRAMTSGTAPAPAAEPAQAPAKGPAPRPSAAHSPGASTSGSHAPAGTPQGGKAAADRLELGTATVTGDREQPKVMYIVPWKKSDIGDLSGKPMNSLLDEALAPVDRDEFKRQVMYYQVVKADASQNGAPKTPAAQGEK
jgi:hypothetical protein